MRFIASTLVLLLAAMPAAAAKKPAAMPVPEQFTKVVACSSVADPQQRLACYDREVAAMNEAQQKGDLVAMDRQQVRKTKKSLFGLALPDLGIFGDDSEEGTSSIETTLKAVRPLADDKYMFDLVEGGRWIQLESKQYVVEPAAGQPIRIRRAAMGSYLANVNKQTAVRVRRVQ